jgi:WD40 repeat protein
LSHFPLHHTDLLSCLFLATFLVACSAAAEEKTTYQDHVLPLIEVNCSKCHNADKKKADLELTSYQGALKGSGSGPVLAPGEPDASKLWKAITHTEEPFMPPNHPRLADKDLEVFKKWILDGLLETADGKAVIAAKLSLDLTVRPEAAGKPDGPPPMPENLPLLPVVHTARLDAITGLAASPWAPLIAVAGQKQVLLFHADTLQPLGILPFTAGQPVAVTFSRNGKLLLASGGQGAQSGRMLVWDVVTGKLLMTLGNEYDTILTADIRADQSQVAFGGPTRLVKILSTKTGQIEHKLVKHTDWVTAVAFSPNGQMLASADRNGGISVWDPDSAQELFTLAGHKAAVTALSWRSDSKLLASSSEDGTVKLWEMQEGKQAKSWTAHAPGALCVSYSSEGRLVTCGRDNAVTLWDANGTKLRSLAFTGDLPLRAVFSQDGQRIFATDFAGHVIADNGSDGKQLGQLDPNPPLQDAPPRKGLATAASRALAKQVPR